MTLLSSPLTWLSRLLSRWASARRRATDRALLRGMGARDLLDLGIGSGEIDALLQPAAASVGLDQPGPWARPRNAALPSGRPAGR
jgi:hypothetical protein